MGEISDHILTFGQYIGCTLDEVSLQPGGLEYLDRFTRDSDVSDTSKEIIIDFLISIGYRSNIRAACFAYAKFRNLGSEDTSGR